MEASRGVLGAPWAVWTAQSVARGPLGPYCGPYFFVSAWCFLLVPWHRTWSGAYNLTLIRATRNTHVKSPHWRLHEGCNVRELHKTEMNARAITMPCVASGRTSWLRTASSNNPDKKCARATSLLEIHPRCNGLQTDYLPALRTGIRFGLVVIHAQDAAHSVA